MAMIDANGLRVHVAVAGDPDGLPLVLIHPLGTDLRIWDRLLPLLPPGLRVLRYDLRGHGQTDVPEGDYWMGDLVADAAGVMQAQGVTGAVVLGLSLGGVIAQGLAAERRDLVRALVLSNTAAKIGTEALWHARMAEVRAGGIAAIADSQLVRWFPRRFHADEPDEIARWRARLTASPRAGYLGCAAALAGTDLRDSTAGLHQPALVIAGEGDGATPPDLVRETADSIVGARFVLIRGAGHLPCVTAPEAMAAEITRFLTRRGLLPDPALR